MAYPNISYHDGDIAASAAAMAIYVYNNGETYASDSDDLQVGAVEAEQRNSDGQLIGGSTFIDARTGTLNFEYGENGDELDGSSKKVLPSYIAAFRGRFYRIGSVSNPITKGEAITVAASVIELQNPMIPELLTVLGQKKGVTHATGALPETFDVTAVNTRTDATVVFSVENYDAPGEAAPAGITINSSTGEITIANTVTAGVYDIKVIASDTVTPLGEPANTVKGWGRLVITITA